MFVDHQFDVSNLHILSMKRALVLLKRNSGMMHSVKKRKYLHFRILAVLFLTTLTLRHLKFGVLKPHERGSHFQKCNFRQEESFRSRLLRNQQARQSIVESRVISPNQFWYAIEPTWSCVNERRIGTHGDGGKYICDIASLKTPRKERCVIYSFGSAGQDDFERALAELTTCQIHIFDPTPGIKHDMELRVKAYGANFYSIGLGGASHEINLKGVWEAVHQYDLNIMSLPEIMDELNHTKIDILKVDIEGSEFDAFGTALNGCKLNIDLVLIEVHVVGTEAMRKIFNLIASFEECGYRMYHKEPNYQGCHGTKCIELAFTRSDCNSSFSRSTLNANYHMNKRARKQLLKLRQKKSEARNVNPRLFWDYYEPDTVCFSLERIGGFHPDGIYTCALPTTCHVLLFGDFKNVYDDFFNRCESVEMHEIHPKTIKFSKNIDPWSLLAIRFYDKEKPQFHVIQDIAEQLRTSCSSLSFNLFSIEIHWDFISKKEEQTERVNDIHELFRSLEACNYAIYHKEPNLYTGRGHRYIMYSWIRIDLVIEDWEELLH